MTVTSWSFKLWIP